MTPTLVGLTLLGILILLLGILLIAVVLLVRSYRRRLGTPPAPPELDRLDPWREAGRRLGASEPGTPGEDHDSGSAGD